jgi:hypothetical protein
MTSPLIRGFCRGVSPAFDTPAKETSSQLSPPMPNINTIAERYAITPRTARNWRKAGVDLSDPLAIARHLADMKRPSISAIRASLEILRTCQNK